MIVEETINEKLQRAGFKLTTQRKAIVTVLLERQQVSISAEELYVYVKEKRSDVGLATVYRTLDILTELNIVYKRISNVGIAYYSLKILTEMKRRQSFHCTSCHKEWTQEMEQLIDIDVQAVLQKQFSIEDCCIVLTGVCATCQCNRG